MEKDKDFIARRNLLGEIIFKGISGDEVVGYDLERYNSDISVLKADRDACADKYMALYEDAVKAGIRTKKKTAEEWQVEQSEINKSMLAALQELRSDIQSLKNPKNGGTL
jgi:hypothetical protein